MKEIQIYTNAQTRKGYALAFYRIECEGSATEGFSVIENVNPVQSQMYAILNGICRLRADCVITAYTNLQILEQIWRHIKQDGCVGRCANSEIWEHIFCHRYAQDLAIVWDSEKVEEVRTKAEQLLEYFLRLVK